MKRVILDADIGTDDAVALFALLHADKLGEIKLECISCSGGNTSLENVTRNVVRLLEYAKRTDIPVYRGCSEQYIPDYFDPEADGHYHGLDGFGDLDLGDNPNVDIVKKEHASVAIADLIIKYPNEISLFTTAPLSTIALAFKLKPECAEKIAEIAMMGGNSQAVGNTPNSAEFNYYYDPESVHVVLSKAKCPILLLPWETCLLPKITLDWRENVLGKAQDPTFQLITKAELSVYKSHDAVYWECCDGFLALCYLNPKIIKTKELIYGVVELDGRYTRGQLVLDYRNKNPANLTIILDVDPDAIKETCLKIANDGL